MKRSYKYIIIVVLIALLIIAYLYIRRTPVTQPTPVGNDLIATSTLVNNLKNKYGNELTDIYETVPNLEPIIFDRTKGNFFFMSAHDETDYFVYVYDYKNDKLTKLGAGPNLEILSYSPDGESVSLKGSIDAGSLPLYTLNIKNSTFVSSRK